MIVNILLQNESTNTYYFVMYLDNFKISTDVLVTKDTYALNTLIWVVK